MARAVKKPAGAKTAPAPSPTDDRPATIEFYLGVKDELDKVTIADPWDAFSVDGRKMAVRKHVMKTMRDTYTATPPDGVSNRENAMRRWDAMENARGPVGGRSGRSAAWKQVAHAKFGLGKIAAHDAMYRELNDADRAAFDTAVAAIEAALAAVNVKI